MPWKPSSVRVVFSTAVNAVQSSLTGVPVTGVSGSGTSTITWSVTPLANTNYTATLQPSITETAGGTPLALTIQSIRILYGDINDDGVVNIADVVLANQARSLPYNVLADMDGNGVVDVADVNIVRSQVGEVNP